MDPTSVIKILFIIFASVRPGINPAESELFCLFQTPGRLCSEDVDQLLCQEYVIFDIHQALPLYLISYSPAESRTIDGTPKSDKPKSP